MCLKRLRETVVGNHRSLLLYKGLRGAVSHVSYLSIEYVEVIEKGRGCTCIYTYRENGVLRFGNRNRKHRRTYARKYSGKEIIG